MPNLNHMTLDKAIQATFKAGDKVLCPAIGSGIYTLLSNGQSSSKVIISDGEKAHSYNLDGRISNNDPLPSIFHDTPAHRAAIATLYCLNTGESNEYNAPISKIELYENNKEENVSNSIEDEVNAQSLLGISEFCSPTPKVIDTTSYGDDEVILIASSMLYDSACEVSGAAEIMHDVSQLLDLICNGKILTTQVESMARIAYEATEKWYNILYRLLDTLNSPLEQTTYGKVKD